MAGGINQGPNAALLEGSTTLYADTAQVEAWFAKAKPGARMIYAHGATLDPKHPTAALVIGWVEENQVIPHKARADGVLQHIVQRRAVPAGADRLTPKLTRDPGLEDTPEGAMLRHLSRCANLGLPCPSNPELARLCGLRDAEAARYRFNLLKDDGHIEVRQGSSFAGRRVLIVSTGKWTAEPTGVVA